MVIDSALDVIAAGPEIVGLAQQAEREGYDAVVLYCFSDPALTACREALQIPVVGAGQCALLAAVNLGYHVGLLTTGAARIPEKKMFAYAAGVAPERLAAVVSIDMDMAELHKDEALTLDKLCTAGTQALDAGAQVLVLGCLSFLGWAEPLSERLHVPVIDPAKIAAATAEMLAVQHLTMSKRAYPTPPAGRRVWPAGEISIP